MTENSRQTPGGRPYVMLYREHSIDMPALSHIRLKQGHTVTIQPTSEMFPDPVKRVWLSGWYQVTMLQCRINYTRIVCQCFINHKLHEVNLIDFKNTVSMLERNRTRTNEDYINGQWTALYEINYLRLGLNSQNEIYQCISDNIKTRGPC